MEYKIIDSVFSSSLEDEVNEAIGEGWEPQGGLMRTSGTYYQAMVRDKGEDQEQDQPFEFAKKFEEITGMKPDEMTPELAREVREIIEEIERED